MKKNPIKHLTSWASYQLLKSRISKGISYRNQQLFHDSSKNVIFVHIPKTAGMAFVNGIYGRQNSHNATALDYLNEDYLKFSSHFSFAVVRNPYFRLISAYHYLATGGKEKIDRAWYDLYLRDYANFDEFVRYGLQQAVNNHAEHFIPQYKFVCDDELNIIVDFIGHFEKLDDVIQALRKRGIELNIQTINTTRYNDNVVNIMSSLSKDSVEIVNDIYAVDFQLFNYEMMLS